MKKANKENSPKLDEGTWRFSRFAVVWRYTLLFALASLIVFFPFIAQWRTLLWMGDGYHQHIKALIFYSDWLKAGCPADYSFSLGFGGNIISTMQHYCLGEPLAALSYFVPRENMLMFYCGLSIFRHYLAGLAFAALYAYCRKGRASVNGCVAGSLIYAYCGFSIHFGLQHPMFVTPMIYLPLMILGIEMYLRDRRPGLFMLAVFMAALSDFYFLYILGLAVIVYYLVFGIIRIGKTGFGGFIKNGFGLLGLAIIGMAMAGVVLAPVIHAFLSDPRTDYSEPFELFFSLKEIVSIPEAVLSSEIITQSGMILGVGALAVPAGFMMITGIRKHPGLFLIFTISLAALTMPVFTFISNGMSTINNRWIFAEALILAVMSGAAVDELRSAGKLRGISVFAGSLLYVGAIAYLYYRTGRLDIRSIDLILIIQVLLVVIIALILLVTSFTPKARRKFGMEAIAFLGVVSVAASGGWHFAARGGNWAGVFQKPEEVNIWDSAAALVADLDDSSFFRYEYPDEDRSDENSSDLYGLSTTGYYYSLSNRSVSDYMTEMAVTDPLGALNGYHGLDGRTPLMQMAGVKYYISAFKNAPFGFDLLKEEGDMNIYRNTAPVSLVHSYTGVLDESAYKKLSHADRQYAMLAGALVEDVKGSLSGVLNIVTPREVSREMKYSVEASRGAAAGPTGFKISEKDVDITIDPAQSVEGEYSLIFTGLGFDRAGNTEPVLNGTSTRAPVRVSFIKEGQVVAENIIQIYTEDSPANRDQQDYLISSKWAEKGIDKIVLHFTYPGDYTFTEMTLRYVDKNTIQGNVSAFISAPSAEVTIHDEAMRSVADSIDVSGRWAKDSIVCFSIPMSDGWTCTVDGESREILKVNGMYMGVEVSAGSHDIALTYQCPMKMVGFIATVAGTVIFALTVVIAWGRRRADRKRAKAEQPIHESPADTGESTFNDTYGDDSFASVMNHPAAADFRPAWDTADTPYVKPEVHSGPDADTESIENSEPDSGITLVWDEPSPFVTDDPGSGDKSE